MMATAQAETPKICDTSGNGKLESSGGLKLHGHGQSNNTSASGNNNAHTGLSNGISNDKSDSSDSSNQGFTKESRETGIPNNSHHLPQQNHVNNHNNHGESNYSFRNFLSNSNSSVTNNNAHHQSNYEHQQQIIRNMSHSGTNSHGGPNTNHPDTQKGMPSVSENSISNPEQQQQQQQPGPGGPHGYPPPPHQQPHHHQYPPGYPPYGRAGYDQHQHAHLNSSDNINASQHAYQHPYPPQQPPMRFPGKPLPGGPPGSGPQQQQQPPPGPGQYPPPQMRAGYPPNPGGITGQSLSQPSGPTPTLNQLLQSTGGAGGSGGPGAPVMGHSGRYPPPGSYDHSSYNVPPHSKADYPGPGWPSGPPPPPSSRPPVNSYGHPPPPQHLMQQQQQQPMYRHTGPAGAPRVPGPGPPGPQHQQYYPTPGMHHAPPGHPSQYPPPPQSPHYPSHPAQRYPAPPGMRPGENQPPSHYSIPPGMSTESTSGLAPPGGPNSSSSSSEGPHPPKSTPPPPPSPSLAQQQQQQMNHQPNPPSPQQSSRSTPVQSQQQHPPPPSLSNSTSGSGSSSGGAGGSGGSGGGSGGGPPSNSPSHRPQGSSPSNNSYAQPPDVGDVTGCNSNDSGPNPGLRPSPSPTGSASSRSMSPAVGNQNIPIPPRPSSSQSDGSGPPRMSQSPMPGGQGAPYGSQQSMAPPSHHMYQSGGKHPSHPGQMVPGGGGGHPPPSPQQQQQPHYPPQGQPHWPQQQQQQPPPPSQPGQYGNRHGSLMSPYPPGHPSQPGIPPNSYPQGPRHPSGGTHPNHIPPSPPGPASNQYTGQYGPGPYGGPPSHAPPPHSQNWPGPNPNSPQAPPNSSSRSHNPPHYLKQHLQQKMGFSSPPHQAGYPGPMGPPQTSGMPSSSPTPTPPPQSQQPQPGQPHGHSHLPPPPPPHSSHETGSSDAQDSSVMSSSNSSNPPNIVSMGPDGTPVDDASQQSTLSNASGASGGDDGPAMPKLRKEGSASHQNYTSHPPTPQSSAVPSPGAGSMSSMHEEYGNMESPGWPRTPASPGLHSHPPAPSEHYRPKAKVKKKPDSLNKLYDMDENPDRRMFLDKLLHFMEDHGTPITACPTISKNPLDLFKLYFLVKERGGFLEVTKNKTWKDIAGSLGIGASSSAAYTLRKHYTKHLLPFECKFDRGGIDPQPLINQVEASSKKKGAKAAPVPSPGSSNSQDSFPGPNNNSSMDGFSSYPSPYGGPPPPDYSNQTTPPHQRPSGPPPPAAQQPPSTQHPGDKNQISVSNPFDDMSSTNQYASMHQFHGSHTQQQGYPSGPPGNYSPYPPAPGDQYSRGPPPPSQHEGYNQTGSYGGPMGSGYPPPGPPGRPMYGYGSGAEASGLPASHPNYPSQPPPPSQQPQQPGSGQGPPSGVQPPSSSSSSNAQEEQGQRYNMGPPHGTGGGPPPPSTPGGYPPPPGAIHSGRSPYPPPGSTPNAIGPPPGQQQPPPPPNGYPNQDYYHPQQQTDQLSIPAGASQIPRVPPNNENPSSTLKSTLQGYPPMPGSASSVPVPPSGAPSPGSGKHLPPHPNQIRRLEYPPGPPPTSGAGKDSSGIPTSQSYPGYLPPPQSQQPPTQQRMPPYDGSGGVPSGRQSFMYPPGTPGSAGVGGISGSGTSGRDLGTVSSIRSSPSPSVIPPSSQQTPLPTAPAHGSLLAPPSQLHSSKQWIPPEGWPNSSSPYPSPSPHRPYPGGPPGPPPSSSGQGPPLGQHGAPPPSTTPTPPGPPGTPPHQAPSPQPWSPHNTASQGPPRHQAPGLVSLPPASQPGSWPPPPPNEHSRYGPPVAGGPPPQIGGTPVSSSSTWSPQGLQQPGMPPRARPPFPSTKGDYNKGFASPPSQSVIPPSPNTPASPAPGKLAPINPVPPVLPSMSPQPGSPVSQQHYPGGPPAGPLSLPPVPPPAPVKKEIVFPPDSVEAVTPVLTKRKKLHKHDVAPVEAWRIMMCLKSGLLAETTWSLDVLNVLLYDDHSVSYFSLSYLPGLMDILLEHLRRSLMLMFGQGVGIDTAGDKLEEASHMKEKKSQKWYQIAYQEDEEEPDIGIPVRHGQVEGTRTVVLTGTNYTNISRIGNKAVGYVHRDDEPFIYPGPRDWDADEKLRNDQDLGQSNDTMELTKHVVTCFTSDLNIVPIVRVMSREENIKSSEIQNRINEQSKPCVTIKTEVQITGDDAGEPDSAEAMNEFSIKIKEEQIEDPVIPLKELVCKDKDTSGEQKSEKINCQSETFAFPSPNPTNGTKILNKKQSKKRKLRFEAPVSQEEENALSESPQKRNDSGNNATEELIVNSSDNATMLEGEDNNSNLSDSNNSDICDSQSQSQSQSQTTMAEAEKPEDEASSTTSTNTDSGNKKIAIRVHDPGCTLKRRKLEEYEDECYTRDEPSLHLVTESQDALGRRCLSIFNILRNLTFIPGNDIELGKSPAFLSLLGKLILLHHDHPLKGKPCSKKINLIDEVDPSNLVASSSCDVERTADEIMDHDSENLINAAAAAAAAASDLDADSCSSLNQEEEWWWDYLHHIREHVLVIIANIAGQMDLSPFSEEISRPILDGLLHWAICPSAYGQDPFPTVGPGSNLSPQRLAIEALCKLSVTQGNVDLLLATPPYFRVERLCSLLTRFLCRAEDQVMREFSINLLGYLSGADSGVARTIALQNPCISLLISFIEQAEANAMSIANNHGFSVLRENPESMGTSLDMLRRAATTLLNLAKHPDNRALFVQHEPRLLQLVMSQILEQKVAAIVAQVLYQCSVPEGQNSCMNYYGNSNNDSFYTPSLSRSRGPTSIPPTPTFNVDTSVSSPTSRKSSSGVVIG